MGCERAGVGGRTAAQSAMANVPWQTSDLRNSGPFGNGTTIDGAKWNSVFVSLIASCKTQMLRSGSLATSSAKCRSLLLPPLTQSKLRPLRAERYDVARRTVTITATAFSTERTDAETGMDAHFAQDASTTARITNLRRPCLHLDGEGAGRTCPWSSRTQVGEF